MKERSHTSEDSTLRPLPETSAWRRGVAGATAFVLGLGMPLAVSALLLPLIPDTHGPNHERARASASSLVSYAYVAVSLALEKARVRAFCGDSTGRICHAPEGRVPRIEDGRCAAPCETM
jgi:hypothetical protein